MQKLLTNCVLGLAVLASACTTVDPQTGQTVPNRTATGVLVGAAAGAAIGAATNTNKGEQTRKNAIIGAGIGALAGAAVGGYMDAQERKMRERFGSSGVGIARTAENEITLNMPNDITFAFDSAALNASFRPTLQEVARTLAEYPQTTVDVIGHADSTGTDAYNQALSERRAASVSNFLAQQGVQSVRLVSQGMGESLPIADNSTAAGRAKNRRVEIKVRAVQS